MVTKPGMNFSYHRAFEPNLVSICDGKTVMFAKTLSMILYIVDTMSENSVILDRPIKSVCMLGGVTKANCTAATNEILSINGVKKTDIRPLH